MPDAPTLPRRRSIRLPGFDYSDEGWYFITIKTFNHVHMFGEIESGNMKLSPLGRMASQSWERIPEIHPLVQTDAFVVMPNHVHGVLWIREKDSKTVNSANIGSMVRGYKAAVTTWARMETESRHVWHRNNWEHVIRSAESLNQIREYIMNNPLKWEYDRFNL